MTVPRAYALLAEVTYRCPLHCPYCSNPVTVPSGEPAESVALRTPHTPTTNGELTTEEWKRVIQEAAALGVLQIGFSGGEPLARRDLAELVRAARETRLYTNLVTSGIGLDDDRLRGLRDAGLDSIQLSFQSDESNLADEIAGAHAHERKLHVAAKIRASGIPLSLNFVIHKRNVDRLPQMIDLAEALYAQRVELANVQFYGWAFRNRAALLPTREQVERARDVATAAKARAKLSAMPTMSRANLVTAYWLASFFSLSARRRMFSTSACRVCSTANSAACGFSESGSWVGSSVIMRQLVSLGVFSGGP